jgi:hypothetical protein
MNHKAATVALLAALATSTVHAGVIQSDCGPGNANCALSISVTPNNGEITQTNSAFDLSESGNVVQPAQFSLYSNEGWQASLLSLSGNTDPILGFAVSANTGATGGTFSFAFSLPVTISGPVNAHAETSYTLTSLTSAGATVSPFLSFVATSKDIDSGSGASISKGVDVGDTFSVPGGPATLSSPTYSATNSFVAGQTYDLMSVVVTFNLSKFSHVGITGFVEQTPVPEPSTYVLLVGGVVLIGFIAQRRLRT